MKKRFDSYVNAEDWLNDLIFSGDDHDIVGELVEVWPTEERYEASWMAEGKDSWGVLYAVWGTEAEVEAEMTAFGDFIDRKGQTGWPLVGE